MPINGLTAGTNYSIQTRAIGGSTGYSDVNDPKMDWAACSHINPCKNRSPHLLRT